MESTEAKTLSADIEKLLTGLLSRLPGFRNVRVKSFSKGSVIVNDEVTFESKDVTADNVTDLLKNHLLNNQSMLGGYLIDVESVQHAEVKGTPVAGDKFPDWAIAVIVCGGFLIVFVLLMTIVLCCRRTHNRKYTFEEDSDDLQYRRSWPSQDMSYPSQYDNAGAEHYKQPYRIHEGGNIVMSESKHRGNDHVYQNTYAGDINYGYQEPEVLNGQPSRNGDAAVLGVNGNGQPSSVMVYKEDDTVTYHDLQKDAWETRL
uniref:SEA domain-containing protein n=1 Tax=Biomphalaria glabrata TaxID=6526 RepID=A0A2C9LLT7_BIOGL